MPSATQAGQRALSLSGSGIMTSTTFIKDTGILRVLPLGLLLLSMLISGVDSQTTTMTIAQEPAASTTNSSSNTFLTTSNSTGGITVFTTHSSSTPTTNFQSPPTTSAMSASTFSQAPTSNASTFSQSSPTPTSTSAASNTTLLSVVSPTTSTSVGTASATSQSSTSTSMDTASTTSQSPTVQSASTGTLSTTTQFHSASPTSTVGSTAITTNNMITTTSSSSMTLSSSSLTTMMNTSNMTWNGTTMSNSTSMKKIYCPSFNCNYSDCCSMYNSQNTTPCAVNTYCQLLRQTDMLYTASCSNSCADSCMNASQTNCAVNCCNSTGCLNYTFASMMRITTNGTLTTTTTTTTTPPATTTTTTSQTTANKGNKCLFGVCIGTKCYASFTTIQTCSSSQPHCQLKNESTDTDTKWTAGCTNCTGYTACKASAKPPCNLECCNATMTSCLWLNGTLNVPSFATRGPYFHTELIASVLCVVAIALLL